MANHDYDFFIRHVSTLLDTGILEKYQIVCEWTDRKEAYGKNSVGLMSRTHGQTGDFFMWPTETNLGENNVPEVIFYLTESSGYKYDWVKTNPENTTDYQTSNRSFITLWEAIKHFMSKR